jgi:hypothetical protein
MHRALSSSSPSIHRRTLLAAAALPWLGGCGHPLPLRPAPPESDPKATALLLASARAHGLDAYRQLHDINIAYDGQWRPLIDGIQPEVVDAGHRGPSEERLMPRLGVNAQAYRGVKGRKFVHWRRGTGQGDDLGRVAVWFNGTPSTDPARLRAAALVAEGYALFLLGPLWLIDRDARLRLAGSERVDGRHCEVVEAWVRPGLGQVAGDRVALFIDREQITRRVRFTLEGTANTAGAVAEVDCFDHQSRFGVLWPMRSYEEVRHPIRLPAHDWRITGLDVNRGYPPEALAGPDFTGAAAPPARAL